MFFYLKLVFYQFSPWNKPTTYRTYDTVCLLNDAEFLKAILFLKHKLKENPFELIPLKIKLSKYSQRIGRSLILHQLSTRAFLS